MKKLSVLAAALVLASSGAFAAGSANDPFVVTVNFTGSCSVKTAATDLALTYASFQTTDATDSTSTVFECSRNLAPTFSFDATSATQTASAAAAVGTAITAEGLIQGVRYTLSGSTSKAAGTAASAGANGVGGSNGTADEYTVTIDAKAPLGQAGAGGGGSGTQTRTLLISY